MQNFLKNFVAYLKFQRNVFLRKSFHHFSFFESSQLHDWVAGHLFNFSMTRKSYLKNKDGSFVEQKILYRMSLKQSLQCVENYPKHRITFWLIYYAPPVIACEMKEQIGFFTKQATAILAVSIVRVLSTIHLCRKDFLMIFSDAARHEKSEKLIGLVEIMD